METKEIRSRYSVERTPVDVMRDFVLVFTDKGWLNRTLRIKRSGRQYRIICNETQFFAYRINDQCAGPHGFPGWPVCIVTHERILEDSEMCGFPSTEPSVQDWLCCLADGDFEVI